MPTNEHEAVRNSNLNNLHSRFDFGNLRQCFLFLLQYKIWLILLSSNEGCIFFVDLSICPSCPQI